jgi:hypothetical protein
MLEERPLWLLDVESKYLAWKLLCMTCGKTKLWVEYIFLAHPVIDHSERTRARKLGDTFSRIFRSKSGPVDYEWGIGSASTDFVRFPLRTMSHYS